MEVDLRNHLFAPGLSAGWYQDDLGGDVEARQPLLEHITLAKVLFQRQLCFVKRFGSTTLQKCAAVLRRARV